ncbi:type I restriction enzyme, S subunit [Algoriphagus faecimaris]|uniref:Type I restriction enzyme, S subunit n=1 Tax=Algoriphagus faecimaris TaxID=686796 RepID=A0A1G6M5F5_9BACT|nr:restriction endonuclease subunit S [Algoriphagus faecimaris]SDC50587.1 type I restriction enzyme, S subunit [Algoriphagus faecimaris]
MSEGKLPKGWKTISLDEISKFVIGGDWGKDPDKFWGEDFVEVACIRGSEIKNWGKEKGKTASIRLIKESSLEKRELIVGDLLIEISGGGPDQPVGRVIRIDEEALSHHPNLPKVGTNFLRLLRIVDNVDNSYVNYYLQYFYHSGEVVKYQGGSNNLRNLKYKEYSKIDIPLAPFPEQRRIVARLDAIFGHLDVLREKLDRIPELLKNFRQQVLTQAVKGDLTKEWREGKDFGEWENSTLKSLTDIDVGQAFKSAEFESEGVRLLRGQNIEPGSLRWNDTVYFPESKLSKFNHLYIKEGEVILAMDRPIISSGLKVALAKKEDLPCVLVQRVARFRPSKDLDSKFLFYLISSDSYIYHLFGEQTGTQIPHISGKQILSFEFLSPPIEEQLEIVKRVDALFDLADKIETQYQSLKAKIDQMPQAVLAKAFSGELVGQEVKEYVREVGELGMVAEEGKAN